jgi:hypothetical protein
VWTYNIEWATLASEPTDPCLNKADVIFVFGQTDELSDTSGNTISTLAQLKARAPQATIVGASTGTSICGHTVYEQGINAVAIGFDNVTVRNAIEYFDMPELSREAGVGLGQQLKADDLKYVLIMSKGLEINGSQLVAGLSSVLGEQVLISGGLAGDGARFGTTYVLLGDELNTQSVIAVGFYGDALRVGSATGGGWREFGPARTITQSTDSTLVELDGTPALDLYERYLGDEAASLPASALIYPLKIRDPEFPDRELVRTVLSVDTDQRTLGFAGDMPNGWKARLMRGQFDALIEGAEDAAHRALQSLRRNDQDCCLCPCSTKYTISISRHTRSNRAETSW